MARIARWKAGKDSDKVRDKVSLGAPCLSRQAVRTLANIGVYEGATRQEGVSEPSDLADSCSDDETYRSYRSYRTDNSAAFMQWRLCEAEVG